MRDSRRKTRPASDARRHPPSRLSHNAVHRVFLRLACAIAAAAPAATLPEVRDAALILLYRLLFILCAEDRRLLPGGDPRYGACSLRRIRDDVGARRNRGEVFSPTATHYWTALGRLCRAIDAGDPATGLPPCGGSPFDAPLTPLLAKVQLSDAVMADVIDALSFVRTPAGCTPIDYRDLGVHQLGGVYERLLELGLVRNGAEIVLQPDIFTRRTSGSYYTPDDLVALIIKETIGPLVVERTEAFRSQAEQLAKASRREPRASPQRRSQTGSQPEGDRFCALRRLDPAERLLELKVCDPAMGAGHFLVSLVDDLADHAIAAMTEAEALAAWDDYVSPLRARIASVRNAILRQAGERGFAIDPARLDDRHILRRMVAARCVYGVDKNPMAVELAKAALRLHTFVPGAPLVFLDHHLRCGDSLFGLRVSGGIDKAAALGAPHLLQEPMTRARDAASVMQAIGEWADAGIADARRPAAAFATAQEMTAPLDALLSLIHAFDWLDAGKEDNATLRAFAEGQFGDPVRLALGAAEVTNDRNRACHFAALLRKARQLVADERFFNWEVVFPDVWPGPVGWAKAAEAHRFGRGACSAVPTRSAPAAWARRDKRGDQISGAEAAFAHPTGRVCGGFDAIIGNPPWDRMKLQQVEWFAARRRDIAMAARAADRRRMIAALDESRDPLAQDYAEVNARAEAAARMARVSGDYPLLSGGDINLYSLFVERAMALVRPRGMVGLLTPSGIASDKTAAAFFKGVATGGRLKALYDFENRRTRFGEEPFFPDVDSRFKFCVFVASPTPLDTPARCAFFLQDVSELADVEKCFALTAEDFARVNPNTATAPVFRSRRDAGLTTAIYRRLPVLVDRFPAAGAARLAGAANSIVRSKSATADFDRGGESMVAAPNPDLALTGESPETTPREVRAWPVRYMTMFHMTNDSPLFRTKAELVEKEKAHPAGGNRWKSPKGLWLPLYEGKMAQAFDHRAASVVVNQRNRHRPAQPAPATGTQHHDPAWLPEPQYWVEASRCGWSRDETWVLGFKEITAPTNERTFISALFPVAAFGNKIPLLRPTDESRGTHLLCANLNSIVFDFIVRQKIQGQTLNRFIVEQLPVIPPHHYGRRFGDMTAAEIVKDAVLELTYTSHDMAPFAADMGFVDGTGAVRPPFAWDDERRLRLRAKLDAVHFHLYGVTERDDIRHVYATFPLLERNETTRHGRYLSRDLCLAWMDALGA